MRGISCKPKAPSEMMKIVPPLLRPVKHPEFIGPALLALVLGSLLPFAYGIFETSQQQLSSSVIVLLTAVLLLFRTRIGTTLYFFLLFTFANYKFERGFRFAAMEDYIAIPLGMAVFLCFIFTGWQQIEHHFSKRAMAAIASAIPGEVLARLEKNQQCSANDK